MNLEINLYSLHWWTKGHTIFIYSWKHLLDANTCQAQCLVLRFKIWLATFPELKEPQSSWPGRKKIKSVLRQSVVNAVEVALRRCLLSPLRCGFCVMTQQEYPQQRSQNKLISGWKITNFFNLPRLCYMWQMATRSVQVILILTNAADDARHLPIEVAKRCMGETGNRTADAPGEQVTHPPQWRALNKPYGLHITMDTDRSPPADQILSVESVPSNEAEAEFKL